MPVDGSGGPEVVAASGDHESFAGTTPDGRIVVRVHRGGDTDVHLVSADGTGHVVVAATDAIEIPAAFASDGRIVIQRVTSATNRDLLVFDPATGVTTPLAVTAGHEDHAALRGTRLVYRREVGDTTELRAVNLDGTGDASLAVDLPSPTFRAFTPSGKVIVASRDDAGWDLWIVGLDGTGLRPLAATARSEELAGILP